MVEFNLAEELNIEPTDVMTGDRNRERYLYYQLKMSMKHAKQIDIIVSFLMESGVRMILNDLKSALDRGTCTSFDRKLSWHYTAVGAVFVEKRVG